MPGWSRVREKMLSEPLTAEQPSIARRRRRGAEGTTIRRLFGRVEPKVPHKRRSLAETRSKLYNFLEDDRTEACILVLIVLDIVMLALEVLVLDEGDTEKGTLATVSEIFRIISLISAWIFMVEMILSIIATPGWRWFKSAGNWIDLVTVPTSWYLEMFVDQARVASNFLSIIRFWRFVRLATAEADLQEFLFEEKIEKLQARIAELEKELAAARGS